MSIIKKQPGHFILLIFQLAYNYFKMFSWFLLYNTTNQLYVYIYPLLHGPLSHPPSRHFRSPLYSTVLCSSFPLALCFTPGSAYIGGACGLQFMGSLGVGHDRVTSLSLFTFMHLEKEMATHSSILAWRIPGMGEPGGLPSMGSCRVGHD